MPFTTIAYGTGHRSQDHDRKTLLEVHLHLEHPATPISLGERWGS